MKLELSQWASIAEVFSAIAIVVSLIFVGMQINDGNRETRAATIQENIALEMAFQSELLPYADTWVKVVTGAPFSDEIESRRAIILYGLLMTQNENQFEQINSGYLELSSDAIAIGVTWPIYKMWQQSPGYQGRSLEFREYLETERKRRIVQ